MAFGEAGIGQGADLGAVGKASIGDDNIQPAKGRDALGDDSRRCLGFGEIGEGFRNPRTLFACCHCDTRQPFAIAACVEHQRHARCGEGAGRRRANAACRAGDQNASFRHETAPLGFPVG